MPGRASCGAVCASLLLLAGGCGGGGDATRQGQAPSGGTLRVGIIPAFREPRFLDPSSGLNLLGTELFRCCLLRTLLSYNGASSADGGSILRPDLARGYPRLSRSGRTWTFHLKPGIRYGRPFENRTVQAKDIVRGIERTLRFRPPSYEARFFTVITGATSYASGTAGSVSGLETPGPLTLVVHLDRPAGDLGNRLALPGAAPLPPGATAGGRLRALPVTGPYRVVRRAPRSLELIRNETWSRQTDALRVADADRIEISTAPSPRGLVRALDAGRLDLPLFANASPDTAAPPDAVRRYLSDPMLRRRVFGSSGGAVRAVSMNLAIPPFDDIHVRRAVNLAINKAALLRADPLASGQPATHIVPDGLENDLLLGYDPFKTPGGRGSLRRARHQIALSRYDRNGDGTCDVAACRRVVAATRTEPVYRRQAAIIARDLVPLGMHLTLRAYEPGAFFGRVIAQKPKIPLVLPIAWLADYASASAYFEPLFGGPSFAGGIGNPSLVGAPHAELRRLGYSRSQTPNIDSTISQCNRQVGGAAFSCWAQADMMLTERIVPWVPYDFPRNVELVGPRVRRFSWDQSSVTPLPALDRIAVGPAASQSHGP